MSLAAARFARKHGLPPETRWLLAFQSCNAVNFTIALGAPMVLTARFLGATEWQVGLLTGLAPFLAGLQLFMTNAVDRLGYRRIMVLGWTSRAFMLLPIIPLTLFAGRLPQHLVVWGLVIPMFLFAVIRGMVAGAWLPWLRTLLPEDQRGYFLGLEQRTINLSAFAAMIVSGLILGAEPAPWRYAVLFAIAWGAGLASAWFLSKMPNLRPSERKAGSRRGLRDLAKAARYAFEYQPFRRAARFVIVYSFAIAAVPAFLVLFLNEDLGWSKREVLTLQAMSPIGILFTAVWFGRVADRAGSRPVLRMAGAGQLGCIAYWILCASHQFTPGYPDMAAAWLIWGISTAGLAISQTRLILASSPKHDVTATMAILQVTLAVTAGSSPVLAGKLLDVLRAMEPEPLPAGSAFAITFGAALLLGLLAQVLLNSVREKRTMPAHVIIVEALYGWPMRVVSGFAWGAKGVKRRLSRSREVRLPGREGDEQ